jgi:hypothetical protein
MPNLGRGGTFLDAQRNSFRQIPFVLIWLDVYITNYLAWGGTQCFVCLGHHGRGGASWEGRKQTGVRRSGVAQQRLAGVCSKQRQASIISGQLGVHVSAGCNCTTGPNAKFTCSIFKPLPRSCPYPNLRRVRCGMRTANAAIPRYEIARIAALLETLDARIGTH